MKTIVTFGNCQANQLQLILSALLPVSEFKVCSFSNNQRTGHKKTNRAIIAAIKHCDILIYQPLSNNHGELCEENIRQTTKSGCERISFPYIFNSGAYSLCHAPLATTHKYGRVFGEEIIIDLLKSGMDSETIMHNYKTSAIDFDIAARFRASLTEMQKRELSTDIKLTSFIEREFRETKLFITHNHPSNLLFIEIIRQIVALIALPINPTAIDKLNLPELPETNCPITPYDIAVHGYKFTGHKDWVAKGTSLIKLIVDAYLVK